MSISIPPATLRSATKVHSESGVRGFESQTPIASVCLCIFCVSCLCPSPSTFLWPLSLSSLCLKSPPSTTSHKLPSSLSSQPSTAQPTSTATPRLYITTASTYLIRDLLPHHFIQVFHALALFLLCELIRICDQVCPFPDPFEEHWENGTSLFQNANILVSPPLPPFYLSHPFSAFLLYLICWN